MSNSNTEGSKIDELNKSIDTVKNILRGKQMEPMIQSASKLALEGKSAYMLKNYEKAYILYGRYMNILTQLQKHKDYQKNKDIVKLKLGSNHEQNRIMDMLASCKEKILQEEKSKASEQQMQIIKDIVPEIKEYEINNGEIQKIRDSIDCISLFSMISKEGSKCLIIDCRPENDFLLSKIDFQFIVNIPEDLCVIGMSITKLQEKIPNNSKVFWEMRKNRPIIVFVDWFSITFSRNTPPWHLRNLINEYDQEIEKKPEMLLLEGGYERWIDTYPMKCTDPKVLVPRSLENVTPHLGEIEYPNIEDIIMKDSSIQNGILSIDRSTKNNAIMSYEKNLSTSELLEKKEKLLNKSLHNESQLMKLEHDYNEVSLNKENEEDVSKQVQLRHKIWELDTQQKDIELEQVNIDKVLKKKDTILDFNTNMSKVEDLEQQLAKQKAERELNKKRQQEALRIARENIKPTDIDYKAPAKAPRKSELILSPRNLNQNALPHFDRASKPVHHQVIPQTFYDKQDFSPVYQKVERGLTGLKNLGNSCYMNSIIQCLSHTMSLTQFLLENNYEKQINRSNQTKGHIVKTLAAVIKMLWSGECKYISSKFLKSVVGEQDNLFGGMDQQDSHEFLVMLIDWLQSDLQSISMSSNLENLPASEKAWVEYTKAKESFILRLFYGQIKSTVKCMRCSEESATFDTFSNLSLELPMYNVDRYDITECFNLYFHGERISGWNCPKCKEPRDAIKKLDISKLPPVLIIHLKRFYGDGYSFRKKQAYVDFPLTDLNMYQYLSPTEKHHKSNNIRYNLYAVSNHYGTMESGHYTAFCRNAKQKRWYKFDDQYVSPLDKSDVVSSAAYILFYTSLPDTLYMSNP
ncbi:hypothetical protein PVAND_010865 [Polypedilum vanderplanki]|uniref:Ubiquitin carboxyl-terminal hydrolase n=1 Tax=Polypedilum vanderplanki TaxID=319348 RepID=A0A9J6CHA7_POLVA|nr:hypothetical protein PVAND_010865 [Polypedilum vanderplanki]